MIEFIEGKLYTKGANNVVVRVGGIGYRLFVSSMTMDSLPPLKEDVVLYAYLHIREDEFSLFGFLNIEEREIFSLLLAISGVGPKLALSILSRLKVPELKRVIILGDTAALVSIPGVGKKTAERIILELKDKIAKQELLVSNSQPDRGADQSSIRGEAVSALLALGYGLSEAQKAVPFPEKSDDAVTVEELVRAALKYLAKY